MRKRKKRTSVPTMKQYKLTSHQEMTYKNLPSVEKTNEEENRKGKHFMIEVQRPIKYKFGKRLVKYMHVCMDCSKSFRNAGLLRRHRLTDGHRMMAKTMIKIGGRKIQRKIYQTRKRTKIEKTGQFV